MLNTGSYLAPGPIATVTSKSALFTVTAAGRGTLFDNTGSYTISLTAAATLGAGFSFYTRCVSGTQTIDPNAAELINGAATYAVSNAGDTVLCIVNAAATAWLVQHVQLPSSVAITGGSITTSTTISAGTTLGVGKAASITAIDCLTSGNNGMVINNGSRQVYTGVSGGEAVIGTLTNHQFGIIANGATAVTVSAAGILSTTNATDASAIGNASVTLAGGLGVALRSYLGTIGSSFKGNVFAGVQDATAAVAGQVGEVISSTVSAAAVASTGAVGNITSISLTAGDWLISGLAVITGGATGLTSGSAAKLSIVTTTATNGTSGSTMAQESVLALLANGLFSLAVPQVRINISATTTYYLTEEVTYIAGSPTVAGTIISTRIR